MHRLGRHMSIEVNGDLVHDEPFDFMNQINYPTNRQVSAGRRDHGQLHLRRRSGSDVGFGDQLQRGDVLRRLLPLPGGSASRTAATACRSEWHARVPAPGATWSALCSKATVPSASM
jgi:hypothetical protein